MGTTTRNLQTQPVKRQSRACASIARRLRRLHRLGRSWPQIANEYGVVGRTGKPSPGLAFLIAMRKYEPQTDEVRVPLGLRPLHRRNNNALFHRPIIDMPEPVLRWALEHREDL